MNKDKLPTKYAPAERASESEIKSAKADLFTLPILQKALDSVHDIVMVLNEHRQLVFANKALDDFIRVDDIGMIYGKRPGEIMNCAYSDVETGGCGTSEFCKMCGAVKVILSSLKDEEDVQDCRILKKSGDALDLRVWSYPVHVKGNKYSIFTIKDIADEQRRRVLERIFFHDIINTASSLRGISELLKESPGDATELSEVIFKLTNKLIDEILAQKQLAAAENNELGIYISNINSLYFLNGLVESYRNHYVAESKNIIVADESVDFNIKSDVILMGRVIGNMLKNALEASEEGHTVTVNCKLVGNFAQFSVHNETYMPRDIQLQVFQRSFSTKGKDRGLGTYSIKLLSERYLKGKVSFKSDEEEGTTFYALYPLKLKQV